MARQAIVASLLLLAGVVSAMDMRMTAVGPGNIISSELGCSPVSGGDITCASSKVTIPNSGGLSVTYGVSAGSVTVPGTIITSTQATVNVPQSMVTTSRSLDINSGVSGDYVANVHNTAASSNYGLQVYAGTNSSDKAVNVIQSGTLNSLLIVRGDGNVGLNTASPGYKLQVSSGSVMFDGLADPSWFVNGNQTNSQNVYAIGGQATDLPGIRLGVGASGTPTTVLRCVSNGACVTGSNVTTAALPANAFIVDKMGIGTASPAAANLFQVGGGTFAVTSSGHITTTGTAPTTSACNSQNVNANSNDNRGSVTFAGGAQTACTVNFINAGGVASPFCTCSDDTGVTAVKCAVSGTALTMSIAVAANDTISYICGW